MKQKWDVVINAELDETSDGFCPGFSVYAEDVVQDDEWTLRVGPALMKFPMGIVAVTPRGEVTDDDLARADLGMEWI